MKKKLIYGAGVSGLGAEKLLQKKGIEYLIADDKLGLKKEEIIPIINQFDTMIKSPGISFTNELVVKAKEAGIKIIDEIELAYNECSSKIIAVTGTNGKTTTTTKLKELLVEAEYKAEFAGNIGNSFAEEVIKGEANDYIVVELSSYQLEAVEKFKPFIAILTNLTPDHMNRYKNLEEYYRAKFNMFKNQDENDYALLNIDDENMIRISKELINKKVNKIYISQEKEADCCVRNGWVEYQNEKIAEVEKFSLKGRHNVENCLFMIAAAKICGIENEKIRDFFYKTVGLEHRTEEFFKFKNTIFINDSKGTNIDATIKALDSYKGKEIILICGGKDKNLDLDELCIKIKEKSEKLFLIGEIADKLESGVLKYGYKKENIFNLKYLEKVVEEIKKTVDFNRENVVLFSPAASSFDQFSNFEERGKIFKELILKYFGG